MKIDISKIATRIAVCLVFMFSSIAISAVERYTIIWSVLGDTSLFPPRIIEKGNSIGELPNPTIEYDGKVFYGWTEIPNYDNPIEPPTLINTRTIPQKNTTYYAVFAEKTEKEKATWDRTDIKDISFNDQVIISMGAVSDNIVIFHCILAFQKVFYIPNPEEIIVKDGSIKSQILDAYIWRIDNTNDHLTIYPNNDITQWLYCANSQLNIGTRIDDNRNKFTIINNFLKNASTSEFVVFKISGIGQWAWDVVKNTNTSITQQLCFFKKNQYIYQNFTTSCNISSLPLQVIEWKKDAIVVMYNGDPKQQAKIYINGNTIGENVTLSDSLKDVAIYKIPISGLASNTNKQLDIIIADQKKTCIIPLIISDEISTNELVNLSSNTDIVIQKGGILTLNSSEINAQKWGNVTIYGGGKIIVGPECAFNASSIIMRVGSVENGEYQAAYPQFVLQGQLGTVSNFYIDYLTTYDRYYALSIPYEVNTTDIHYPIDIYGANVLSNNKGSFTLQYYDGALRAETGMGWKDLDEPAILNPYQGYTFWGAPKKVSVNGAEKERQKFGIHRLPVCDISIINENEVKNNLISVIAHGNEQTNDNDRGWNFLGNPYLAEYNGSIGDIRYITQTNDGKKYFSNEVANVTLDPFNTYFVQVDENQNIPFNILNSPYMQSPRKDKYDEISTGILLSCDEMVDRVGVLIADRYTENYDFNADLAKFDNHDLTIYAISKSGKLSYTAISPQTANQSIEIGYKVLEGNQFTFQFDNSRYEAQDIDILYLIDKELNVTTDLLQTDYSFYSDAGTYDQRFALDIWFHENNTTSIPQYSQEPSIILENQSLNISNLPVGTRVSIYNVLGHCFYQQAATSSELSIQLPRGYYILYINCAQGLHRTIFIQ